LATYNRYTDKPNNNFGSTVDNKGFFNKILRGLSNWGMDAEKMVIRNTYTTGIHEDPTQSANQSTNMYDIFSKKMISKVLDRKSIAFLDRAYEDKRKILKQYSIKDEIKGFVTDIADECIIYDDNNFFCRVKDLPDEYDNTVKQKFQENFLKIYRNFGFIDGLTAWNYLKLFLVDGYISFEVVYDNKQKNIIELQPIDPMTLIVAADPESGSIIWIQHPDDPQNRRVLLDSQIIYLSYSNNNEFAETSYVENLIRPYNQLKMIEQTRLLFNINQAAVYKKFIVPTNGLTRQQAEQQIYQLMSEYHEDVQWDDQMGTVSINGSTNVPHSKDFWFPQGEGSNPTIEIMPTQSVDLNEDAMLKWFLKNLKTASKIPFQRFDDDSGGGTLHDSASEMTRAEIKFGNFIKRLQTVYKEILIKPLRIQMILDFPELRDDNLFHSSINLVFNANELFEEWKYLNNLAKKAEIASNLSSNLQDSEQKPYLSVEYIVRHIMKFSDADIAENNKYKISGGIPGEGAGASTSEGGGGGSGEMPAQGGSGEMPAQGGSGEMPAQGGSEAPPAQGGGEAPAEF
jgi:hypothetical protein